MLSVNPVLEDYYFTNNYTECYPLGTLHFGSTCRPTSPKIRELKARYDAHHATENDCTVPDLKIA